MPTTTAGGGSKRRRRTVKRGNSRGECCEATYHGLHVWFKHMFEHLGWMLLAKKRGHMDKVQVYKQSLLRLKTDLEQRMKYMKDADRKQDLKIMLSDLAVLIEHTNKDFP
jgi:TnpA family transposase